MAAVSGQEKLVATGEFSSAAVNDYDYYPTKVSNDDYSYGVEVVESTDPMKTGNLTQWDVDIQTENGDRYSKDESGTRGNELKKLRAKLGDYFYYAISGRRTDGLIPTECHSECYEHLNTCCTKMTYIYKDGKVAYDNVCMNKQVADQGLQLKIKDFRVSISCDIQDKDLSQSGAMKMFASVLSATTLAALTLY